MAIQEPKSRERVSGDPLRNRKGAFVKYGTSVSVPLEAHVAEALGVTSGDSFRVEISPDYRSFTIYLDNPNDKAPRSHAASKGR